MSLPRYIDNIVNDFFKYYNNMSEKDKEVCLKFYEAGKNAENVQSRHYNLPWEKRKHMEYQDRFFENDNTSVFRKLKKNDYLNQFELVEAELFLRTKTIEINDKNPDYYTEIKIQKRLLNKLRNQNSKIREENEILKNKTIDVYKLQNRVYNKRVFPASLKQLIYEKDNFKCVICGNKNDLQVDHIIEWEDGGLTTFTNGQTLCKECNIGKHYHKKFKNNIKKIKQSK